MLSLIRKWDLEGLNIATVTRDQDPHRYPHTLGLLVMDHSL